MRFEMTSLDFDVDPEVFTEIDAPNWLTGVNTIRGSTMDCRWFWENYVLALPIGGTVETDFQKITRMD
jgi:hypothetical protein